MSALDLINSQVGVLTAFKESATPTREITASMNFLSNTLVA